MSANPSNHATGHGVGFFPFNLTSAFSLSGFIGGARRSPPEWSRLHWIMALVPGTYFAVTNYFQHAFITSWFGSAIAAFAFLIAFLAVYNAYALVVRAQWWLSAAAGRLGRARWRMIMAHVVLLTTASAVHLFAIAISTSLSREGGAWRPAVGDYFVEIWISCMPIWGLLYVATLAACHYARQMRRMQPAGGGAKERAAKTRPGVKRLAIRDNARTHYLDPEGIRLIEAHGDYVKIYSGEGVFMPKGSVARFESDLKAFGPFLRVHRSILVRASFVAAIQRTSTGAYIVQLGDGGTAPLSRRKVSDVRDFLSMNGDSAA